ncbi:hypothetical protein CEXT_283791 [Caerostris extrusa]|uniref:Uncharacterized protein n=1 Tax=Caerostris extrusa TaxID=172846 RepID=A0AAV4NQF6_CAEEX|nr:hypothetical protein CEXT_283791 [Caerostris extrusa]
MVREGPAVFHSFRDRSNYSIKASVATATLSRESEGSGIVSIVKFSIMPTEIKSLELYQNLYFLAFACSAHCDISASAVRPDGQVARALTLSAIVDAMLDKLHEMETIVSDGKAMFDELENFAERIEKLESKCETLSIRIDESNDLTRSEIQRLR